MKKHAWIGLAVGGVVAVGLAWRHQVIEMGAGASAGTSQPVAAVPPPKSLVGDSRITAARLFQHSEELPAWCVAYGREFWRRGKIAETGASNAKPVSNSSGAPFDLGDVIGRVSHAFVAPTNGTGPAVKTRTFSAEITDSRIRISLKSPAIAIKTAGAPLPEAQPLAALASKTPETPEEEDALMAGLTALEQARPIGAVGGARGGNTPTRQTSSTQTEITFETAAIRQGDHAWYTSGSAGSEWAVLGNTAQRLLAPAQGLLEHFEAQRDGIATTWLVGQRPIGSGDLLVEAHLNGLTYASETAQGFHFVDANGAARIRIGHATVVDSKGSKWPAPVRVQDHSFLVTVTESILNQAEYPLAIDPIIAPEFGMDQPVFAAAPGPQQNPAIATNGSTFLVVWEDQRTASANGPSIYGARIAGGPDGGGVVEDPNGIAISPPGASSPAVGSATNGFLVVWADGRNASTNGLDIYGARIDAFGKVLDPGGLAICAAAGDQLAPAVTAAGGDSFVVWQDGRDSKAGPTIYGARVSSGGVVAEQSGFPISPGVGIQASPAAAFNGQTILVVWSALSDGGDFGIQGARVSPAGTVLDGNSLPISVGPGEKFFPRTAANGANFLVVWEDHREEGVGFVDIYGEVVPGAGPLRQKDGVPICAGVSDCFTPTVAAGLTDYLVLWQDSRDLANSGEDIFGARVSLNGKLVDTTAIAISAAPGDQSAPALAFNGVTYAGVWSDPRNLANTDYDIYGTLISPSAVVGLPDGFVISSGATDEQHPAVAFDGDNYLVVWEDNREAANDGADILGVRVGATGGVLDLAAIPITTAPGDQTLPAVSAGSHEFLVVWQDARTVSTTGVRIYATRVSDAGVVLDQGGIPVGASPGGDQLAPAVASDGTNFFIAWQDGRNLAVEGVDIFGAPVNSDGKVLAPDGLPLSQAVADQYAPSLAFNGTEYLVVWSDERDLAVSGIDVFGVRVSTDGQILDAAAIPISQAPGDAVFPAVSSVGGGFLVAWEDGRNAVNSLDDIFGARVDATGQVLDPDGIPISVGPGFQATPAVAAFGGGYLVVWTDGRSSATPIGLDIYGARVSAAGVVQDPDGIGVNSGASDQQAPKLAAGSASMALVVNQSMESGSPRVVGNFVSLNAAPPQLAIQAQSSGLAVTWPASAVGYALQWTSDLTTPIHWEFVPTTQVFLNGDQYEALILPGNGPQFFSLTGL